MEERNQYESNVSRNENVIKELKTVSRQLFYNKTYLIEAVASSSSKQSDQIKTRFIQPYFRLQQRLLTDVLGPMQFFDCRSKILYLHWQI